MTGSWMLVPSLVHAAANAVGSDDQAGWEGGALRVERLDGSLPLPTTASRWRSASTSRSETRLVATSTFAPRDERARPSAAAVKYIRPTSPSSNHEIVGGVGSRRRRAS